MQFKRAKVILLPTENKSNLFIGDTGNGKKLLLGIPVKYKDSNNQHLYIISDDEIKEGDWFIDLRDKKENLYWEDIYCAGNGGTPEFANSIGKKIIATTDTSLSKPIRMLCKSCKGSGGGFSPKCSICKGSGIRIEYDLLPQPSQQFIEKYIEEYNKGNIITDILVEYEVYMQRQSNIGTTRYIRAEDNKTFEKLNFERVPTLLGPKVNPKDNTITIKKLKDSWNREEVISLLYRVKRNIHAISDENFDKWIKENL